jgi:tripeptidyl-peptidase-1
VTRNFYPVEFIKMRVTGWLLVFGSIAASSPLSTHAIHEKRHAVPVAWNKHSRAPKDALLPVRIGLNQRNLEHSDRFLDDISDPESPNFGKK